MALTKEQARELAECFRDAAAGAKSYLDANHEKLTPHDYETINESRKALIRASASMTTEAVGLAIADMQDPVSKIKGVTNRAKEKIEGLQKVGKVISSLAALVDLAAGIMARDAKSVISSVKKLKEILTED